MAEPKRQGGDGLLPCPFCAKPLFRSSRKINPSARCLTDGCYGQRMSVVNLDDPVCVAAWNTRAASQPTRDAVEGWDDLNPVRSTLRKLEKDLRACAISLGEGDDLGAVLRGYAEHAAFALSRRDSATPPVREDREVIARVIDPLPFAKLKDLDDRKALPNVRGRSAWQARANAALEIADKLLSLPVQPGAGERE